MISAMTRPSPSPIGMTRARSYLEGLTDVQQIVEAAIWQLPLEHVEGRELARLLDPQSALHQQLEQCPVPEGIRFGCHSRPSGCLVPAPERIRTDVRHFTLEVEHGRGQSGRAAPPRLLEPDPDQVVAAEWEGMRRIRRERRVFLSRPGAQVGEERPHVDEPGVGGRPPITPADPLHLSSACERMLDEGAAVPRTNGAARADPWL